jgi:hypothetical protein
VTRGAQKRSATSDPGTMVALTVAFWSVLRLLFQGNVVDALGSEILGILEQIGSLTLMPCSLVIWLMRMLSLSTNSLLHHRDRVSAPGAVAHGESSQDRSPSTILLCSHRQTGEITSSRIVSAGSIVDCFLTASHFVQTPSHRRCSCRLASVDSRSQRKRNGVLRGN